MNRSNYSDDCDGWAEVLRLADEMTLRSYEEAQCACYTEEEAKSRNAQSSARAALVRLLGGE